MSWHGDKVMRVSSAVGRVGTGFGKYGQPHALVVIKQFSPTMSFVFTLLKHRSGVFGSGIRMSHAVGTYDAKMA